MRLQSHFYHPCVGLRRLCVSLQVLAIAMARRLEASYTMSAILEDTLRIVSLMNHSSTQNDGAPRGSISAAAADDAVTTTTAGPSQPSAPLHLSEVVVDSSSAASTQRRDASAQTRKTAALRSSPGTRIMAQKVAPIRPPPLLAGAPAGSGKRRVASNKVDPDVPSSSAADEILVIIAEEPATHLGGIRLPAGVRDGLRHLEIGEV